MKHLALNPVSTHTLQQLNPNFRARTIWNGKTLLSECLEMSPFKVADARRLLSDGADPNALMPDRTRPIWYCRSLDALRFLVEEAGVDLSLHMQGWSSGQVAAYHFSLPMLRYFFFDGPHVARLEAEKSAKFFSAELFARDSAVLGPTLDRFKWNHASIKFFLSEEFIEMYGNPAPIQDHENGETLLHRACARSNSEAAYNLIKVMEDVDIPNHSGQLPIHLCGAGLGTAQWTAIFAKMKTKLDFSVRVQHPHEPKKITFLDLICKLGHISLLQLAFENCEPDSLFQLLMEIRSNPRHGGLRSDTPVFFQLTSVPQYLKRTFTLYGDRIPPAVWQCESVLFALGLIRSLPELFHEARRLGMHFSLKSILKIAGFRDPTGMVSMCPYADLTETPSLQDFSKGICVAIKFSSILTAAIFERALSSDSWRELARVTFESAAPLRSLMDKFPSTTSVAELDRFLIWFTSTMTSLGVSAEGWTAAAATLSTHARYEELSTKMPIVGMFYERLSRGTK